MRDAETPADPESQAFVADHERAHGTWPSRYGESGFDAVPLLVKITT